MSAGLGAGRPTPAEQVALDAAGRLGVVVCQTSRVGSGRVSEQVTEPPRVFADNLAPWKARIVLQLALRRTADVDEVQACFDAT